MLSDESVDFLDEFSDTTFVSTAGFIAGLSLRQITFVSSSSPNTLGKACLHSTYTSDCMLESRRKEIVTILSFMRCTKTSSTSVTATYSVNVTNPNPRGSTKTTTMRTIERYSAVSYNLLLSRSTMIMQSWIVPNLEKYSDSYSTHTVRHGLSTTYFYLCYKEDHQ